MSHEARTRGLAALGVWLALTSLGCYFSSGGEPTGGSTGPGGGPGGGGGVVSGGPPTGPQWINVTGNLAGMPSECGTLSLVSARPDRDTITVGIALRGLWRMTGASASWSALGQGSGSAMIINRPSGIVYDPDHPEIFWEAGVYNGGGVYKTTDDGATFSHVANLTHNDRVTVDLADPQRRTMLVSGHEQPHRLLRSTDGGSTFTNIGDPLPEDAGFPSAPVILDPQTYLVGSWGAMGAGIFKTTDGGATWAKVFAGEIGSIPLQASDKSLYWVIRNGTVVRSTDQGNTWSNPAPPSTPFLSHTVLELPDGRLVAMGPHQLAISTDHASTWRLFGTPYPYDVDGGIYSPAGKAFYVWHINCGDPPISVAADSLMTLPFDYQTAH